MGITVDVEATVLDPALALPWRPDAGRRPGRRRLATVHEVQPS